MSTVWGSSHLHRRNNKLPPIGTTTPSAASESQHMIPYGNLRSSASAFESDEKMRLLETRMGVTEKSSRELLEEVLRTQTELKMYVARNEQDVRDEKQARTQLDTSIHIVKDLISQLASRIRTTEDKLAEEKAELASLMSHTKGVEQAVLASQQELHSMKDVQGNKLMDLQVMLLDSQRSREQLEKAVYTLTDEMRIVHNRLDSQQAEYSTVISELKLRAYRLEEENKRQMNQLFSEMANCWNFRMQICLDALRRQGDMQSHTEHNASLLREQVEARLSELRDVLMDLESRQYAESNERRSLEQKLQQKLSELRDVLMDLESRQYAEANERRSLEQKLQQNVNEVNKLLEKENHRREGAMHTMDMIHREKEHAAETDKLTLQSLMTENLDEMSKRLLTKDIELKEEMQQKQHELEQTETEKQAEHEQKLCEDSEQQWAALKQQGDEEMHNIKEVLKAERAKTKESIKKLDESITLLEKQLEEQAKVSNKIMTAEIQSRKNHERYIEVTVKGVQEELQISTSSLEHSIGGVNEKLLNLNDKIRQDLETVHQGTMRILTDMDVRLLSMKQRVTTLEQTVEDRISEVITAGAQCTAQSDSYHLERCWATFVIATGVRDKVAAISLWQDVTSQTIRDLDKAIQKMPKEVQALEEKQKLLTSEMESRVTTEAESRIRDVENLKQEIAMMANRQQPNAVTQQDLQEVQATLRRLAESVQTVKTVLGMEIQSEQKLRSDDTRRLEEEIEDLRKKVEPLVTKHNFVKVDPLVTKRNFVKNELDNTPNEGVNQWSIYNALRWLKWKDRIMFVQRKNFFFSPLLFDTTKIKPPGKGCFYSYPRGNSGLESFPCSPDGSPNIDNLYIGNHTSSSHTGSPHTGSPHIGGPDNSSLHNSSSHIGILHTSNPNTGSPHTSSFHNGSPHTGNPHNSSPHIGSPDTSSTHTGNPNTGSLDPSW